MPLLFDTLCSTHTCSQTASSTACQQVLRLSGKMVTGRPIVRTRSIVGAHLFSWRAILSAPLSVSFLMAPFSRSSRSAEPADPPLTLFRRDRPLAVPEHVQLTGHAKSMQMSLYRQCRCSHRTRDKCLPTRPDQTRPQ